MLVPTGAERNIGKSEEQYVLHHFFPKVMINSESLILRPILLNGTQEAARGLQVLPKRFLDDETVNSVLNIVVPLDVARDGNEDARRKGKVE